MTTISWFFASVRRGYCLFVDRPSTYTILSIKLSKIVQFVGKFAPVDEDERQKYLFSMVKLYIEVVVEFSIFTNSRGKILSFDESAEQRSTNDLVCFICNYTNAKVIYEVGRVQTWTKTEDPRNTLPFALAHTHLPTNPDDRVWDFQTYCKFVYSIFLLLRTCLYLYPLLLYNYCTFCKKYLFFFFFFSFRLDDSQCSVFVWGSKTAARVDSRGSCSTACQQSGVRVIHERHVTLTTTSYLQDRDHAPFRRLLVEILVERNHTSGSYRNNYSAY